VENVPTRPEDPVAGAHGVSVVVPVFNSARTLAELAERIEAALSSLPGSLPWELILVNDGSGDASWERIVGLSREDERLRGMDMARNFGQHNALLAGIHAARYEVIVTLDDDLQHPPEEIPRLIDALGPDMDVVYGVPVDRRHPAHRKLGAFAVRTFLLTLTRHRALRVATGFRAFRSDLAKQLPEDSGRRVVLDPLLRTKTRRFGSIPVDHQPRRVGRSNYSLPMLFRFAVTEIAVDLGLRRRDAGSDPSYWVRAVTESQSAGDGQG
jgi:glycosyltransferase involved in cell wall biosynthesis